MVLAQHPHPNPRLSTCSALASWASSGSVPLGAATISSNFLFLCVSFSQALSVSYLVLRLLVRACRQEELHGGGVTVARGPNESRGANLYMRGKRMEDGVSERQKRGTRVPASSGSLPLGKATISSNFLSLCVSFSLNLSQSLSISLNLSQSLTVAFASLSAPAARRSFTAAV